MNRISTLLGALLLGAGAMYYLDPDQGRRRRALAADRVGSVSHDARDYLDSRRKRTTDRVRGWLARMRNRMANRMPADEQLNGQIRARLGRVISYPHAIHTEVSQGRVVLRGDILADEFNPLMAQIWSMRGVTAIDSHVSLHPDAGNVPALQGKPRRGRRLRMRRIARTAASTLALAGAVGAGMGAMRFQGAARAGILSLAMGLMSWSLKGMRQVIRGSRLARGAQRRQPERNQPATERIAAPAASAPETVPAPASSAWH